MRDMQLPIEIRPAITVAIRRLRETVRAHLRAATCLTAIDLAGLVYGRAPARRCVWNLPRVYANDHLPPRFHIVSPDAEALVEIATLRILAGSLPRRTGKAAMKWAAENIEPIKAE